MHITLNRLHIAKFKAAWPCHGLPDVLDNISFVFDVRTGDLVDVIARTSMGFTLDTNEFDGAALVALSHDASDIAFPDVNA